ncbi:hypothetical protein [Algoriphagus halophilus]|uniref:Uncharacterized protein n=1 Tax=Algoriphagus halophilus TaxID=226505 RepID=A0A1N6D3R3_9BACT|nr:hypothetical protein [Algoriphagus halophilus]SIN65421.1 hypothetical protein SAMN05444394_0137 [Algoriphagus halophilus]
MSNDKEVNNRSYFPFNSYDVFGYLIPGSIFLVTIYVFDFWAKKTMGFKHNPIYTLFELFRPPNFDGSQNSFSSFEAVIFILITLISVYLLGHIISIISSFYIDRVLIKKGHYYPISRFLIGESKNTVASNAVKSNFIFINVSLSISYLLSGIYISLAYSVYSPTTIIWHSLICFCYLISIIGLILSISYTKHFTFWELPQKIYNYLTLVLKNIVGKGHDMSDSTIEIYKEFVEKKLRLDPLNPNTDVYWMTYLYVSRKSPSAVRTLLNWLHLYSFSRNVATAFYLSFIYSILSIGLNSHQVSSNSFGNFGKFNVLIGLIIPFMFLCCSFIFLLRFYYLYNSYYSKFLVRSAVYLYKFKE